MKSVYKTVFIVNPYAKKGSTETCWPSIEALARDRLGSFKTFITQGPGDARRFASHANANGVDLLICVGGDGTFNEVINGLMDHDDGARSGLTLGFVPNGTGCDFVRTVAIPTDYARAIDLIATGRIRSIDVGRILFREHDGRDGRRFFHNITSLGLGGEVDQRVNRTTKAFGPFFSFMWATLVSLVRFGKKKIRLKLDDASEQQFTIWNVVVANGQFHGGGMWVAPEARVDDGLLDVTVIGDLSLPMVFLNLSKLYNGKINHIDKVVTYRAKRIEAWSDQRVLLDVDGEQPGILPVVIDVMPRAIEIIAV
jgi:YegS/Rv2252/BmrU family lipid kinase